ncbi:MAG: hypothetical protein PWQ57_2431 [Desulfovibrionales bacterium]|nr:hypothetical protein [Desulfovibrionales bacterium]
MSYGQGGLFASTLERLNSTEGESTTPPAGGLNPAISPFTITMNNITTGRYTARVRYPVTTIHRDHDGRRKYNELAV